MATQWHPLFARLLGLLIDEYYEIQTEVKVSDLPRASDFLVIRRQGGAAPEFRGLWNHLTDWNIMEFKGPAESAHDEHLLKLIHVGAGLALKINEDRAKAELARLPCRDVSFWYLVSSMGDDFLRSARLRTHFEHEGMGLLRGRVWGHPFFLVAYRDLPVEEDSIPLKLVERTAQPLRLGEMVVGSEELRRRFASWLASLHPDLFAEVRGMQGRQGIIDWEKLAKYEDLSEIIPLLPPEVVVQRLGTKKAIEAIGAGRAFDASVKEMGKDEAFEALRASMSPEEWSELLRRHPPEPPPEGA